LSEQDLNSFGGGISVGIGAAYTSPPATISGSKITGNGVTATGNAGFVYAAGAGIEDNGSLVLRGSNVSYNHVSSTIASAASLPTALSDSGGMEIDGQTTITGTNFIGNSVVASSQASTASGATASVGGALVVTTNTPTTITGGSISGNSVRATNDSGAVNALGGGIFNGSVLTLRGTVVSNNTGVATGSTGLAQGGGIWNSDAGSGTPGSLTLIGTSVIHNSLSASPGVTVHGGGVFNSGLLRLKGSVIAQNSPDQCYGC